MEAHHTMVLTTEARRWLGKYKELQGAMGDAEG
jgi:hypothetical protein